MNECDDGRLRRLLLKCGKAENSANISIFKRFLQKISFHRKLGIAQKVCYTKEWIETCVTWRDGWCNQYVAEI